MSVSLLRQSTWFSVFEISSLSSSSSSLLQSSAAETGAMSATVLTSSCSSSDKRLTDATNFQQDRHRRRSLTAAATAAVQTVEKVKRCLFGAPDHQTTRADLSLLRRQLEVRSRQRWNFDFRSGVPLTSTSVSSTGTDTSGGAARWAWTRVSDETMDSRTRSSTTTLEDTAAGLRRRRSFSNASRHSSPRRTTTSSSKRPRMSFTPSVEVKVKDTATTGSEVKSLTSRRKSVNGGLERRRLLRSTSLLGSPSRM